MLLRHSWGGNGAKWRRGSRPAARHSGRVLFGVAARPWSFGLGASSGLQWPRCRRVLADSTDIIALVVGSEPMSGDVVALEQSQGRVPRNRLEVLVDSEQFVGADNRTRGDQAVDPGDAEPGAQAGVLEVARPHTQKCYTHMLCESRPLLGACRSSEQRGGATRAPGGNSGSRHVTGTATPTTTCWVPRFHPVRTPGDRVALLSRTPSVRGAPAWCVSRRGSRRSVGASVATPDSDGGTREGRMPTRHRRVERLARRGAYPGDFRQRIIVSISVCDTVANSLPSRIAASASAFLPAKASSST